MNKLVLLTLPSNLLVPTITFYEIACCVRALKDGSAILRKYSWGAMTNKSGFLVKT